MAGRIVFWSLLGLWVLCLGLSVRVPAAVAPGGTGLARVSLFFQFQIAAIVLTLPLWYFARHQRRPALRWLGRAPGILAMVETVAVLALLLWANLSRPAPELPEEREAAAEATEA